MSNASSELRALARQSSHYLFGRVGVIVLSTISLPIFLRLLSLAQYGLLGLTLKIVGSFVVLAKLGLQNSVLRFYAEHASGQDKLQRFYSTFIFAGTATMLASTLLFGAVVALLRGRWIDAELADALLYGTVLVFLRAMQSIQYSFLRVEERTKTYNVIEVYIKAAGTLVIFILLLVWETSLRAFLIGLILVEGSVGIYLFVDMLRRRLLRLSAASRSLLIEMCRFGVPLIGYEASTVVLDAGDRILIQHYLGAEPLGLYSAAYNLSSYLEEAVMAPLRMALLPLYIKLWVQAGQQETARFLSLCMNLYLLAAVGIAMAGIVTARDLLQVAGSAKLLPAAEILPLLVIGFFVYALHVFLNAGLLIHKKTKTMAVLIFVSAVINIALNVILIPRMGLPGAAIAMLISYSALVAFTAYASRPLLPLDVAWGSLARWLALAAAAGAVVSLLDFQNPLAGLLVKGGLCVALFFGPLALLDPYVKSIVSSLRHVRAESAA